MHLLSETMVTMTICTKIHLAQLHAFYKLTKKDFSMYQLYAMKQICTYFIFSEVFGSMVKTYYNSELKFDLCLPKIIFYYFFFTFKRLVVNIKLSGFSKFLSCLLKNINDYYWIECIF